MTAVHHRPDTAAADLGLFVRRFLSDYARNPVNLLVLVLVPVVFVVVAAGPMADAAKLLGGIGPSVETATAGWAAGFLAGVAMYFQTRSARTVDRRVVLAGLPARRLVAARIVTGLVLAVMVSAAALLALVVRTGIDEPGRVIAGTVMFAVIYLAIGALVGTLVRNPVNGTVLILFIWIMDVFFGPSLGSPDRVATRGLPTHFLTLWMVDLPSRHGGRLGDLGWALVWTAAALAIAWLVLTRSTRIAHRSPRRSRPGSGWDQFVTGLRLGLRDYRRNPVLLVLLVVVPVIFIWLSKVITPDETMVLTLVEDGTPSLLTFWLPDMHAGTMTPIAVASLATLAGLFVVLDSRAGDRRLMQAGFCTGPLLGARLGVIGVAVLVVTGASLAVTATVFDPRQWGTYLGANLLLAATYALIGVCLGPIFGPVGGVFIAFLVPFLDIGIAQSPMLRPEPVGWARMLPGYGADRVLLDGGLTAHFDQTGSLLLGLAWLFALAVLAAWLFRRGPPPRAEQGSGPDAARLCVVGLAPPRLGRCGRFWLAGQHMWLGSHPAYPWCIPGLWLPSNPMLWAQSRTCCPKSAPDPAAAATAGDANASAAVAATTPAALISDVDMWNPVSVGADSAAERSLAHSRGCQSGTFDLQVRHCAEPRGARRRGA